MAVPNRRGGNGRKKTVIRRIEQEDARQVCYSKRRQGFFTKASDLAVLTGAQVAALAFSPGGNAYSFGHPSVDSVVDRFLAREGLGAGARAGAADKDSKMQKLSKELDELRTQLMEMNKRTERTEEAMAKERASGDKIAAWVGPDARDMGDEDIAAFFAALMQVKDVVSDRANQILVEALQFDVSRKVEMAPPPPPQIFSGSTFEAGMDVQQMAMPLLPQHLLMEMPPAPGLAGELDVEQMQMTIPPPPGCDAGLDMEQMQITIPPSPWFDAGMEMEQFLMDLPPPEFPAGTETVHQGLDQPNAGFPY